MKRLLIILFVISLLVGIYYYFGKTIEKKAEVLDSKLESLYSLAENENPNLEEAVMDTEAYWEETELIFTLVTNHKLTDNLDEDILMLKHYVGINDEQHLMVKIAECRSVVQEILKDDDFALHNIF